MTNPRGRQPVGFNQPPNGGTDYPIVSPSADIKQLFADFFVSFENDSLGYYSYPLKLSWLHGFGTNAVTPPAGYPTPVHDFDLIVSDADDNVVFDSTVATNYSTTDWDNRLKVIEWETASAVCRCVIHTDWTAEDEADGLALTYDDYIEPENAELHAECWYELPKRVRAITVGVEAITQKQVVLQNGYNCDLALQEPLVIDAPITGFLPTNRLIPGVRKANRIQISAVPGSGLGVFPGCVDTATVIRTINKVRSSSHSNFTLDSEGCIRQHRPVGLTNSNPRTFSYAAAEVPASQARAAIRLSNDCKNCCDCEYFARTYQGIKRQWLLYREIARNAEIARDLYKANRERWLAEKAARARNFINVRIVTDSECKVRWGISLCNASNCCLVGIKIQVFFITYGPAGNMVYPTSEKAAYCADTYYEGSPECFAPTPILPARLDAKNLVNLYEIDYADPQTVTSLYGKHCMPFCYETAGTRVKLGVVAYWETKAPIDSQCEPSPNIATDIPADITMFCGLASVTLPTIIYGDGLSAQRELSSSNAGCTTCDCKPEEL